MSTESLAQSPPEPPGGSPGGADGAPDLSLVAIGVIAVLAVVAWAALGKDSFDTASAAALAWVLANFAWLFVIAADVFLVMCVVLAISRFGRIRLGADDSEPEFTNLAWIAMMFSAGMGIGLMFYGVGEPLTHYLNPPPSSGAAPGTGAAAQAALDYSFFHWTLTPWAIYGIAGLALAYATFRKGRGNRLSSAFVPLMGQERADGWPGRAVDLLAVFATVFGTATSLGLGALQVAEGLSLTAGTENSTAVQLIIIASLSAAFVLSAFSGLHKGVKWLSTINLVLAAALMLFVFVLGPTVYVLDVIPASVGSYLHELLPMATRTGAFTDSAWLGAWTIFYWAWWLSWAPFVGTFIARISRGRTIREFLIGVLLVPSGATAVWFCVMGGTAIRLDSTGAADLAVKVKDGAEASLFAMLDALPLGTLTSYVAMVLVMTYFVTSADSASLVMGSLTSRGSLNPPTWLVVTWGILMAAVAAVLLVAGGLKSLQTATILVALPFVLVMLLLCWALVTELRQDPGAGPARHHPLHGMRDAVRAMVGDALTEQGPARHHRLRRVAGPGRAGRGDDGAGTPEP
ncbi:BCCT family transporter [Streptomyces goshikiensis]|uniref:BCCT family transporter n=1 Tax=Streptomyces TaxID=1883 RepID=UPI000F556D11|nr:MULTISPECIES: BCCT family transporter [Streptomyces]MBP0937074.1 BCCT family transporter [Streptomyces sp. KCTC 0041BP]RPK36094.1 Glycine betaine transporter BetP [Streptomyces sp. ADI91-18]WBY22798.1 BCCT family transporter [Streptomyces goshikiensis]WSS01620.1 BCCT family transporter [Streptomyces goshikiensis]WSX97323.1 BCCT family transporter [Streptomyces goshikiensis]